MTDYRRLVAEIVAADPTLRRIRAGHGVFAALTAECRNAATDVITVWGPGGACVVERDGRIPHGHLICCDRDNFENKQLREAIARAGKACEEAATQLMAKDAEIEQLRAMVRSLQERLSAVCDIRRALSNEATDLRVRLKNIAALTGQVE